MKLINGNIFMIWKIYQRRAESISYYFDMDIIYYHYTWEEHSKIYKAVSYIFKSFKTTFDLIRRRPSLIFIQLPPIPLLYIVGLYGLLTNTPYIADCHNSMFLEWWIRWPYAKSLLRKAAIVIVHNEDIKMHAENNGLRTMVMRDPLPHNIEPKYTDVLNKFGLSPGSYVIVPWNFHSDEPIEEFVEAVRLVPKIIFTMTWFSERLPNNLRMNLPRNLIFTGYLEADEFNDLFINAGAALTLTTLQGIQPSAASEAIAFGVPIVMTDTETARNLYSNIPVFVENYPQSIAAGIENILENRVMHRDKVVKFEQTLRKELEEEIKLLETIIQ